MAGVEVTFPVVRYPDLRIVALRLRLPMPSAAWTTQSTSSIRITVTVQPVDVTDDCTLKRRLPADSGVTVWDSHPLPCDRRASVGCSGGVYHGKM